MVYQEGQMAPYQKQRKSIDMAQLTLARDEAYYSTSSPAALAMYGENFRAGIFTGFRLLSSAEVYDLYKWPEMIINDDEACTDTL